VRDLWASEDKSDWVPNETILLILELSIYQIYTFLNFLVTVNYIIRVVWLVSAH